MKKLALLVDSQPSPKPPRPLGKEGAGLWNRVMTAYHIDDAGGIELLAQACAAADRAESLRAQIDEEGELLHTRTGPRDHPLLKHEISARAFVCRTLCRLGLNVEPIRGIGRPGSGGLGVTIGPWQA
jgi:hypothetical protein